MPTIPPPPVGFEPIDDPRQIPPPPPGFEPIEAPVPGMEQLGGVPPGPAQPPQAVGAPPAPANRGELMSGLIGGTHGVLSSLGGATEMAGKLTGITPLATLGGVIREDQGHKAEAYAKPAAELKNIKSGGDFLDWAQFNLANLAPSLISSTGGAVLGGIAGTMIAGPAGTIPGSLAGAGAVSYLLNAGEVYANLREQGVDAPGAAAVAGIPMAMLDVIEPTHVAGKLFFKPVQKLAVKPVAAGIKGTLATMGKQAIKEGAAEGITEGLQEGIGAAAEDLAGGKTKLFSADTASRILNAAAAGALGGVAGGVVPNRSGTDQPQPATAGQQQPPAAVPGSTTPPAPGAPPAPAAASPEVDANPADPKVALHRSVAVIDHLKQAEGPLTKSAIVDALEIGPREAGDVLDALVKQGAVVRNGKGYALKDQTFTSPGEEAAPGRQIGLLNQALEEDQTAPRDEDAPPPPPDTATLGSIGQPQDAPEAETEPPSDPAQPRPPSVEPAYGHNVLVNIPGEDTKYQTRYAVREAADVHPSHNPMSFEPNPGYEHENERDYKDPQNGARVLEYSSPASFEPDYLVADNPTAEHGASIVDPRGNVLGGNNRAMTLKRVYGLSPQSGERYKAALAARAQQYGINPAELARFKNPVLVRERTSAINAGKEITDYNKKGSAALRPNEQAVTDGKRMSARSIAAIVSRLEDAGDEGSLADALRGENGAEVVQSLIADGVLTDQEAGGLLEQRGKEQHLTSEAKSRIGKALVGRLFPNAQAYNLTTPDVRKKLERAAVHIARAEGQPAWGLTNDVREALEIMERLRAHGAKSITVPTKGETLEKFVEPFIAKGWLKDLAPLLNAKKELSAEGKERLTKLAYRMQEESVLTGQGAMQDGKPVQYSPRALAIARTLRLPDTVAAKAFRNYANDEALSRPGSQRQMFEPPAQVEAFREAFESETLDAKPAATLFNKRGSQARPGGAFHHARVGGPRYQPSATLAQKSEEAAARAVEERGTSVILTNGQGWDVLMAAAGLHHAANGGAGGILMHPDALKTALRRLKKGTALRTALEQADPTQFLPVVNTADHYSDGDLTAALTEELDHLEQVNATGEIEHVPLREFFAMPEAEKAGKHLERQGYEDERAGLALEIGVRLMRPGRYVELGLSPEEAVRLADHYVWLLRKRHGDAPTRVIVQRVTKAFEDYARGTEKALQFGHRRSRPASDGVDRGTEARGPPSHARGVATQERGQLALFAREAREAGAFYSNLQRVITDKMPERASGAQIEGLIRNPQNGVKPDEVRWTGFDEWLKTQKGPIAKADVLSYLAANAVQVREVIDQRNAYKDYSLPGGKNYTELLLTFPVRHPLQFGPEDNRIWRSTNDDRGGGRFSIYQSRPGQFETTDRRGIVPSNQYPTFEAAQQHLEEGWAKEQGTGFTSSHWTQANVLAHVRFNERTDSQGDEVLFVQEIQSDWHQKGRKKGYREAEPASFPTTLPMPYYAEAETGLVTRKVALRSEATSNLIARGKDEAEAIQNYWRNRWQHDQGGRVAAAPFAKSWHELAFRRIVRWAAEKGFAKIGWPTGEQQAALFDLSKHISRIEYVANVDDLEGLYNLTAFDLKGTRVISKEEITLAAVEELVGKDIAEKIRRDEGSPSPYRGRKQLAGLDLKVGGEGMKGFYDDILVKYAEKFARKFGATVTDGNVLVGQGEIDEDTEGRLRYDASKEVLRTLKGNYKFDEADNRFYAVDYDYGDGGELATDAERFGLDPDTENTIFERRILRAVNGLYMERLQALRDAHLATNVPTTIHTMTITPQMRDTVMKGQPLFARRTTQMQPRARLEDMPLEKLRAMLKANDPNGDWDDGDGYKLTREDALAMIAEWQEEEPSLKVGTFLDDLSEGKRRPDREYDRGGGVVEMRPKEEQQPLFARRKGGDSSLQPGLFGDFEPITEQEAQEIKQSSRKPTRKPSGPSLQGGLFDAAEEEASQDATRRDQAALQADEMQQTLNSPLPPKPQRPTKRPTMGQGGLFDQQADLFSEPEPADAEPVSQQPSQAGPLARIKDASGEVEARIRKLTDGLYGVTFWDIESNGKLDDGIHAYDTQEAAEAYARERLKVEEKGAAADKAPNEFQSIQANITGALGARIREWVHRIPAAELAEKGREDEPHITLTYGLHTEVTPDQVKALLEQEGPFTVTLGKASLFETEDGDVLKVEVDSTDLHRLHGKLREALPNTQTHPTYKPHLTLAYLKKGAGAKYAGKPVPGVSGQKVTVNAIAFSDRDEQHTEIPLGRTDKSIPVMPMNIRIAEIETALRNTTDPAERQRLAAERDELQRQRADIMAQRSDDKVRDKNPLLADQIPATDPEKQLQADKDQKQAMEDTRKNHADKAAFWRGLIADKVGPEAFRAMTERWDKFTGPHNATYEADFWRQRYREAFGTEAPEIPAAAPAASDDTQQIMAMILPDYVRAYPQYRPEVTLDFAKRDAERLAIIYRAIKAAPGQTTEQIAAALPDAAFPDFMTVEGERELQDLTKFIRRGAETLEKGGMIRWVETDEINGAGGWHTGKATGNPANADTISPNGGNPPAAAAPPTPATPATPTAPAKMILTGDTYNHRSSIKRLPGGAEWNGPRKGWIVDDTPENRAAVARMSKRIIMGEWGAGPTTPRPPAVTVTAIGDTVPPNSQVGGDTQTQQPTPVTPQGLETPTPKPATVESEEAPANDDAGSGRRGPERVPGGRQPAVTHDRGALAGELPPAVQGAAGSREGEDGSKGSDRSPYEGVGPSPGDAGGGGSVRVGDGGMEESPEPVIHVPSPTTTSTPGSNTRFERDYRIPADRRIGGTPEKRYAANVVAIRTLRSLEAEDRLPTPAEADTLAAYVGWGAVPQLFAANKPEWAQRQGELRELLTPEEYEHAQRSTTNAHYTSDGVVRAMWAAMRHLGAKPGMSWLEPAVGVGNFLGLQPAELLDGARRVAIDKDTITGKIAQKLYPDSGVEVTPFEEAELPDSYFDAAVSNVPFGRFGVHDPSMKPQSLTGSIHNYFFAKSLHYVRPGGVVAFITSRYTMDGIDKPHVGFRNWIQGQADFLGAVRLPSSAFEQSSGTKVITDVIFLRRRLPDAQPAGDSSWLTTGRKHLKAANSRGYEYSVPTDISSYYLNNPGNVLGEQAIGRGMHSDSEYTVKGEASEQQITDALQRILPKDAFQEGPKKAKDPRRRAAEVKGAEDAKVGALFFDEKGDVYRRTSKGTVEPAVGMGVGERDRLKRLLAIRNTLLQLLDAERTGAPDGALRQKLNLEYDIFHTKYGPINKLQNRGLMDGDPDQPLLLSLETSWNAKKRTAKKAEIFGKAVLAKPEVILRTDSAQDALMVSLNEGGGIDWDRMTGLTGKTAEQLQQELQGVIFEVPTQDGVWQTADEYLSGSVRKKLRQARAQAKVNPRFQANVKALEAVQPEDIPAEAIYARLGVSWVPSSVYEDFIRAALGLQPEAAVKVQYAPALGQWVIEAPDWAATSTKFATAKMGAGEIIKHGMNMRKPVITMMVDKEEVTDPAATAAANQKLDELQEYFQEWLLRTDPKRAETLTRSYNDLHNDLRLRQFDGSHLTLPGLNKGVTPFKHQLAAIWRTIVQKNALLAHAVGAGKTLEAIAAGMELKRMGLVNRPMYVVPNATLSGWQEQFAKFYPGARVLVFTEKDLAKKKRQEIMARIATGSWDAVVVPHSSFQFLGVGDDLFQEHYEKLAGELEDAIKDAEEVGMDTRLIKRMETQKENLLKGLKKKRADEKKDKVVTWEQLGIDHLFIDESHEYKKLGFATKQSNVAGIDQNGNQKTFDLRMKMAHVQRHGRGVTFMTGTPITNTMGELYSIMKYLIEPEMKARGIAHFDEWAAQFGRTVAVWEPKPEGGGYQAKNRFAKFVNLPELMTLFRSFADVVTGDMLDIPRPTKKEYLVTAQMSEEQEAYLETLQRRAERIRQDPRKALPDNMLSVFGDAAKMALEQRMVMPNAPDNPHGRLSLAAEKIYARYLDTMRDKGTQLVFMDMGTPDGSAPFKTYNALIEKLVKLGIPRSEIAYIHQAKNKDQRAALFEQVREGEIRVMIGSSTKMGVGTNVQDRVAAMHHLDLPARPSDVEQRVGRGIRQGNRYAEVENYTYLTAGTLDELKSASLARKAAFIHNALSGKLTARESEDIGELAATFQLFQAATSRDPRIQRKMEVDAEVSRLQAIRWAWREQRTRLQGELATAPGIIARYKKLIPEYESMRELRDTTGRVWEVDGQRFEGEGIGNEVGEALTKVWAKNAMLLKGSLAELPLGTAHGFALTLHKVPGDRLLLMVKGLSGVELGQKPPDGGTVRAVENMLKGLEAKIADAKEDQARFERRVGELQAELAKPFPQEEKLRQYMQEQGELFQALDAAQNDDSAVAGGSIVDASVEAEETPDSDEDDAGDGEEENDDGSLKKAAKDFIKDESGELRLPKWFTTPPAVLAKLRNPAKAVAKALNPDLIRAGLDQVAPLDDRIERQGTGTGKALMDALRRAGDLGEVSAGKRMVKLLAAGLDKLTKEERYNLLDALEGRVDPMNDKVKAAYTVSRAMTNEIAAEAEDLEVTVRGHGGEKRTFAAMEDYYPHVSRGVDALKAGPVRKDVLENLVRLGIRPDADAAKEMLDQHIEFMEGKSTIPTKVLDYLVRTGQAKNGADALAKLQRTRAHVKRQGNIEYTREVNLPFYDPDPARVLPSHVVGASIRLAQVAELGQDNQVVNRLIRDIAVNGGNADWTRRAVDKIIGFANDADEQADKVSRFLRALQGFKLGLAVIPNATQSLNTLLLTDLPSLAKGIRAAMTTQGQHFAIETGATLDPVLHETVRELATGSRHLEKFLKATGFSTVERFNRIVAANAGAAYTLRQLRALKKDPKNLRARRKLAELGIDVDRAIARGKISGDELLISSKRLVDASQFRARPQDLPEFASDPWGKVFFQFKSFAYQQTRLVKQAVTNEVRDKHYGRGLRNLAILTLLFPLAGEGVRQVRAWLTGRKRDLEGLERYLDSAAAVGSLGILWDMIEGSRRRKLVETLAGPSAGMAADVVQTLATKPTDAEAWKKLAYRHAPLGSIGRRLIEGPQ